MHGAAILRARLAAKRQRDAQYAPLPGEQKPKGPFSQMGGGPVRDTDDLRRVLGLPRREEDDAFVKDLTREMTKALLVPEGTQELRPVQALALHDLAEASEAGVKRGLFVPARVGAGKTLIALLAPTVVGSLHPLLLVPAKLVTKTQRDQKAMRQHWPVSPLLHIESYERVSRVSGALMLESFQPDLIIADECHRLKNRAAAVTRRVYRYMEEHPNTIFVALSGTITKRSLNDYGHLLKWSHKDMRPVPLTYTELESWALAIDEKVSPMNRKPVGALARFCNEEELAILPTDPITAARRGYQRRLADTIGVVTTPESMVGASIQITQLPVPPVTEIVAAFQTLRHEWMRPDGVDLADPREITRHARELALGGYYRWSPPPPEAWMDARRAWNKFVRATLGANHRNLDSMLQVANAVDAGIIDGQDILGRWRELEPTFKPNTEWVWLSDVVLKMCASWAEKHPGIIWVEHVAFATRLEQDAGLVYYGREGLSKDKRFIDDHAQGRAMIASAHANNEGRNLQAWSESLTVGVFQNGSQWEQVIGRQHRPGQEADEVSFDVIVGCFEHVKHWEQSLADARYQQDTLGQPQKLLYADCDMPSLVDLEPGRRDGTCADCRMHTNKFAGKVPVK